jgi:TonB family protein
VQAVQLVSPEQLSHMRFRLPKTSMAIEATGRLVWQLRSKKEAGIQFVELSSEARDGIRQWIGAEASRAVAPSEPRQKTSQREKPAAQVEPQAPVPAATVLPAPETPVRQTPASSAANAKAAKPKPSPLPAGQPAAGASRIPNRPSPVPPATPAPQFTAGLPLPKESAPPNAEPQQTPADLLSSRLPSAGSAFPPGRIPLRNAPHTDGFAVPPPTGTVPNVPSWNGYVAPGLGMRYRRPRRWWTYTAALGIIAAVGFAGLMMIDPSTISRARLATAAHQPDTTRNLPQDPLANNTDSNASPNTPTLPSAQPPIPTPDNSAAANAPRHQAPQALGSGNASPTESSDAGANESGSSKARLDNSANSPAPPNSASAAKSTNDGEASAPKAGGETPRPDRSETSEKESASAGNSKPNTNSSSQPAEPKETAPAGSSNSSSTANRNEAQPSSSAPAAAVAPASAPVSATPPSTTQPSVQPTQKDQDDYAHTAKRDGTSVPSGAASSAAPPRGSSVVMSGGSSSPVPPSVPLVGVPSGSVGATSRFHSFRIPPELQSKAAQLAGSLQIGQILSSYSPSYPIEAARAGVEGIVRLDVMVAPNGNVESVTIVSGPPMLAAVSVTAVKQWHYGETLLGGQPIEAEQYVTLVFRLAK